MRTIHTPLLVLAGALLLAGAASSPSRAQGSSDPVLQAMQDELSRSMLDLKMKDLDRPYFISYRVDETTLASVGATFGSITRSDLTRSRVLTVEVRVGSPALDNTNFLDNSALQSIFGGRTQYEDLPLDDDYPEIRRKIWLATDAAYKNALDTLSRKKALLQSRTAEEIPDFSEEHRAATTVEPAVTAVPDTSRMRTLARRLSGMFRSTPEISTSEVSLTHRIVTSRYVNSEGTRFRRSTPDARFECTAGAYAPDGLPLRDYIAAYGHRLEDLPSQDDLAVRIGEMARRTADLSRAGLLESYAGPVLVEGDAAAEILAQVFIPELIARHKALTDNPQLEMLLPQKESAFVDRQGLRVLPAFLSVEDDPTATRLGAALLLGDYPVDDDGIPASRKVLVENGLLKGFLSSRNPARGASYSSGNRRGGGVAPGNILVTAQAGASADEMREKLITAATEEGLPYGIVIRRIADPAILTQERDASQMMAMLMGGPAGQGSSARPVIAAWKVHPDGKEELVRNVEVSEIGVAAFKDILAASSDRQAITVPFPTGPKGAASGIARMFMGQADDGPAPPLVTIVTPSFLFKELSLRRPTGQMRKPPVAAHPFFAK